MAGTLSTITKYGCAGHILYASYHGFHVPASVSVAARPADIRRSIALNQFGLHPYGMEMVVMTFQLDNSMINQYFSQGYLVFRGIVPPSLLRDLRAQADRARDLAHRLNGPQTQRIQPLSQYAGDLDLKPFDDYTELPELRDAIMQLLGPDYTHGHVDIMGLLVEPLHHPWNIGWHRDGVVEVAPEARDDIVEAKLAEVWYDLRHFNQVNCAIYAESCTWFVPGSHLRQWDLPGERQTTGDPMFRGPVDGMSNVEAERLYLDHCQQFPGAVQMHLGPGDFMVYRNLAWHNGNYLTYQPRATIHDIVRYEGEKSWIGWQQAKQEAVERVKARQASSSAGNTDAF